MSSSSQPLIAIISGVGPGTGAAVARKFSAAYPVVLMARNPDNYEDLVKEINGNGGKALGISTDVASSDSVKAAMEKVKGEFGEGVGCAVSSRSFFCLGWRIHEGLTGRRVSRVMGCDERGTLVV